MKLFLIRHGESDAKGLGRRQGPDSPLSQKGILQVKSTASYLKTQNINQIISSTWARAKESAEIISKEVDIPIVYSSLIHEKEQNPDLYYVSDDNPLNQKYLIEAHQNWTNFDWSLEGKGETIRDVFVRALKFKKEIFDKYSDTQQNIAIVTHGHFLRSFISAIIMGEDMDDPGFKKFYRCLFFGNASVNILDFSKGYPRFEGFNLTFFHE